MADVEVSRVIAAPAAELYDMVSDLTRMGDWSPENQGGRWLKGAAGPAVGARFQGENSHGGRSWSTTAIVEVADPGREFTFRSVVGPIKVARWSYRLETIDDGTRVTESWTDMRGWFAKRAGAKASGVAERAEHNRAGMEATLDNLAAAAEG